MPKRARRWFRKRWIFFGLLVCVGMVFAASRHPFARKRAHEVVSEAIRRELGLVANLGPVELQLPFQVAAYDIRLDHPTHGPLAEAHSLVIEPSLTALLLGRFELKHIQIEGARVRLKVEDGRAVNLPDLKLEKKNSGSSKIPLEELLIRHAQIVVDAPPHLHASLDQVSVAVRIVDGDRINLRVSANGGRFRHLMGEESLDRLRLIARVTPSRVEIDSLELLTSLATLGVKDSSAELPLDYGRYKLNVDIGTNLTKIARLPHGYDLPSIEGGLAFRGTIEGAGSAFHGGGDLEVDHAVVNDFGFGLLKLKVDVTPEEIRLLDGSQAFVIEDGGTGGLVGSLGLGEGLPLDLRIDFRRLQMHKLMKQLDVSAHSVAYWDVDGAYHLKGTLDPVAIEGPIDLFSKRMFLNSKGWDLPGTEVLSTPQGELHGRVRIDAESLNFDNVVATLPHSKLDVDLSIGFARTLDISAHSDQLDMRDVSGVMGMNIDGHGSIGVEVHGPLSDIKLTGKLDMEEFALADRHVGHLRTRASMEKGGLAVRFTDIVVDKNVSHYEADDLLLDFTDGFVADASARFDALALTDFYHSLDFAPDSPFRDYVGTLEGTSKIHYSLGRAEDSPNGTLDVEFDVGVKKANLLGIGFTAGKIKGKTRFRDVAEPYHKTDLELQQLWLKKRGGSVHVRGNMNHGGHLNVTVLGEHLPVLHTEPFQQVAPGVSGNYSIIARVDGTLSQPRAHMDLTLTGVSYNNRVLGDARAYVRVTDQKDPWIVEAKGWKNGVAPKGERCARGRTHVANANWQADPGSTGPRSAYVICGGGLDGHVALDLAVGQAKGWPIRGVADLVGLPLATLFPRRRPGETPITGNLHGSVEFTDGILDRVDSLVGRIDVTRFALSQGSGWVRNDGPVNIELTRDGFRIERAQFKGQGSGLTLSGKGSVHGGLAGSVRGRMDMATLATLSSSVEHSRGLLDVDVTIAGRFADPVIHGTAQLHDSYLKLSGIDYPLEKLGGKLSFSARQLLLEDLHAEVAGGKMQLRGTAVFKENRLARYELFVDGKSMDIEPMVGTRVGFGTSAKLTWSEGARVPKLTGTLRLERVSYTRDFKLGLSEKLAGQLARTQRAEGQAYDPARDRIALDLRVVDSRPARVSNNLLDADLRIEDSDRPFRIVGTDQRIGVTGNLSLTRGKLRFRNTEFEIESGEVSFSDEHSIEPRFDVRARTEIARTGELAGTRWQIGLHAVGDADDLRLDMSSEPALSQEDIALLLAVGMTRAEAERLQAGELGGSAALEALATVTGVDREVKKAVPVIDDFQVSSAYSVQSNRTEPQITVGKNLSEGVRATATTGIGEDTNFRTGVEWRLNDQTSVQAAYDNLNTTSSSTFGNVGVDLRWRLEFD